MEADIDYKNYWQIASRRSHEFVVGHWKDKTYLNVASLCFSIVKRLFSAYFIIPPMCIFVVFFLQSYSNGLSETLFLITSSFDRQLSESEAHLLVSFWLWFALIIFGLSWVIPWESPAARYARSEMDRWHRLNGDKMLPHQFNLSIEKASRKGATTNE